MNVARIRGFLLQLPKPSIVRCTSGDGEPQDLKPGKSYAKCAESIAALGAELLECLDSDGKLLRALRTTTDDAQRSDSPALPTVLAQDPNAAMLSHFANLIHRAYEHSTEIAFVKLVDIIERIGDRSEAIEQRLERAEALHRRSVQEQVDDAFARAEELAASKTAEGGGDFLQNMAGAFLSGQVQKAATAAPKPPPAAANGKANGRH